MKDLGSSGSIEDWNTINNQIRDEMFTNADGS
jgi:hypothetical protein